MMFLIDIQHWSLHGQMPSVKIVQGSEASKKKQQNRGDVAYNRSDSRVSAESGYVNS